MTEHEIDRLLVSLVRRFEITKLRAEAIHDEYLGPGTWIRHDLHARAEARVRWQRMESACIAILQRIDRLAERQAA